jgi:N-methylhydantoinase A
MKGLTREAVREAFEAAYRETYGRLLENIPTRVMNYRIAVIGRRPKLDMAVFAPVDGKPAEDCRIGTRKVFADGEWHEAGVYERLATGSRRQHCRAGPARAGRHHDLCRSRSCCRVDAFGNLVITQWSITDGRSLHRSRRARAC